MRVIIEKGKHHACLCLFSLISSLICNVIQARVNAGCGVAVSLCMWNDNPYVSNLVIFRILSSEVDVCEWCEPSAWNGGATIETVHQALSFLEGGSKRSACI